jgi:hypothetical protein
MGIWPKYADGTDINGVDVCSELGIIATADDSGFLNILNFPSVVEEAPRRMYSGHSSFVQNVRFLPPPVQPGSGSDQRLVPLKLSLRCPAPPLLLLVFHLRALFRILHVHTHTQYHTFQSNSHGYQPKNHNYTT